MALVTLDQDEAPRLAAELGIPADLATMAGDERVREVLQRDIDDVNARFARIEQIKRFDVLERDLSQAEGELTPTLKVKRPVIYARFADRFERLYEAQFSLRIGSTTRVATGRCVLSRLAAGETVLDLGSGASADVLISAKRVGPTGQAIGLDMTDEMLELARANAADGGVKNAEFVKGYIEDVPLPDSSVDVVISNCVINLAADKRKVLAEAARVLRPGGRFAVSDVIADDDMDDATRADMAAYTGCIAGALTEHEFRAALAVAGLIDIEIRETHRVHEHARSAIVRARKP